jgi:uncharacterized PurR-regulated membrane protein YhhQ (DUF165 family)
MDNAPAPDSSHPPASFPNVSVCVAAGTQSAFASTAVKASSMISRQEHFNSAMTAADQKCCVVDRVIRTISSSLSAYLVSEIPHISDSD